MKGKDRPIARKRRISATVLTALCVFLILAVIGSCLLIQYFVSGGNTTETKDSQQTSLPPNSAAKPTEIEKTSGLQLNSLYTSSIINPDCNDEFAEEILSLEITNASSDYLLYAKLIAHMSDGSMATFILRDLPSGQTAYLFDVENKKQDPSIYCLSIVCEEESYTDESLIADGLYVENASTGARITNVGNEIITDLKVVYRCSMGDRYFGGVSYEATIRSLEPGETWNLDVDALLGIMYIVRIY